jgi:hypothetical protein
MKSIHVFLGILLISLIAQSLLWSYSSFTDQDIWMKRITYLTEDSRNFFSTIDQQRYSEHPGMPVVMIGALAYSVGFPLIGSLIGSVSLFISLTIAAIAVLARKLYPDNWWWLGASGLILFNPLFYSASPTDAVVSPLIVLTIMLVLLLFKERTKISIRKILLVSLCIGLALATRIHITLLIVIPTLGLMIFFLNAKRTIAISLSALLWAYIFIPLIWFRPGIFLRETFLRQISFFSGSAFPADVMPPAISLSRLSLLAPLSIISVCFLVLLILYKQASSLGGWKFITIMFVSSAVPIGAMFVSQLQSYRYFFPLFFLWEAFLPLWLIKFTQIRPSLFQSLSQKYGPKFIQMSIVIFLILGQAFVLLCEYI